MQSKNKISATRKVLYGFVMLVLMLGIFNARKVLTTRDQDSSVETLTSATVDLNMDNKPAFNVIVDNTTSYTFTDVPDTYWAWNYIEQLYSAGITNGCSTSPLMYCPLSSVTRAQMAIFILRGMYGKTYAPPAATGAVFSDVSINTFGAAWIEQLAKEGITSGCGVGKYCPNDNVTRAQMAIFLLKGKYGSSYVPLVATGIFSDVPIGSFAVDWIEQLAVEGITIGCSGGLYCPSANVLRDQMAVFLVKTFMNTDEIYYVSPNGADANAGTLAQPWRTIQNAANIAPIGSTTIVLAGNYAERVNVSRAVTLHGLGTVIMRGFTVLANYVTIRGFEITDTANDPINGWGIFVQGSNCLIDGNYIHYATRGGILLSAGVGNEAETHDCVVQNNRLYRNSQVGVDARGRNHLIENNEIWGTIQYHPKWTNSPDWVDADGIRFFGSGHIIRKNYVHDILYGISENRDPHIDCFQTWSDGSYHEAASNIVIEQNLCLNLQGGLSPGSVQGFMIEGARNLTIRNNIIRAYRVLNAVNSNFLLVVNNTFTNDLELSADYFPNIIGLTNTPNSVIQNNIFYDPLVHFIYFHDEVSRQETSIGYNCIYRSDGVILLDAPSPNDLWMVDPLFVDALNGDFHLQVGSPLIDAGVSLPVILNDYDDNLRPQGKGVDIGAYEYFFED